MANVSGNLTEEALLARVEALEARMNIAVANYNESLDSIWMLLAAMLVFFMHSGFSLLEAGSVRIKNAQNILAKNIVVVTLGFMCWYFIGYPLAFEQGSDANSFVGGSRGYVLDGFGEQIGKYRFWFFQGTFCATGGTIVSGAMAERTQLKGFATYTILMTSIIYPIVVYWTWSGHGFLNWVEEGKHVSVFGPAYMDFAGSGTVHLIGGIGALCGALLVGPRKGRYQEPDEEFVAHNIPLVVLGTFFLWFGWYGFNPGSTLQMHTAKQAHVAALVAVNTTLAACVAGLTVFLLRARVVEPRMLDVGGFCNGILAGLVAVTASCAYISSWEAMLIGFVGGLAYQCWSMALRRYQVDDVVDASAVHGSCGLWGVLACGLFGNPDDGFGGNGLLYGGDQMRVQLLSALILICWSGILSVVIMFPLRILGMLRMSDTFQDNGADAMEHSPAKAYSDAPVPVCRIPRHAPVDGLSEEDPERPFGRVLQEKPGGWTCYADSPKVP